MASDSVRMKVDIKVTWFGHLLIAYAWFLHGIGVEICPHRAARTVVRYGMRIRVR